MRVQPVGDATDPTPPADDARIVAAQHDVDALPREPATLVEAGLGPSRLDRPRAELEHGPLRGRTPGGSSSMTRSRSTWSPKRTTCAGERSANGVRRTGPVTTTRAGARSPR